MEAQKDINLGKYAKYPTTEIYLDPRPRIRNIVQELEEEHDWNWPPRPPKDWEKSRAMKRRRWSFLYSKELLDFCSVLSMIIGPWELLLVLAYVCLPKTFVPALRESSEFSLIFVTLFLGMGLKHLYAGIIGLSLRSMRPDLIGFVYVSYPLEPLAPLLSTFLTGVGLYSTQRWRVVREMAAHLKAYDAHWFSKSAWDKYQSFMKCCGIDDYTDWQKLGPSLELSSGALATVPKSCCAEKDCHLLSNVSGLTHSWGCLDVTSMSTDAVFVSALICSAVALLLSIFGRLSHFEAQDYVGDPIHTLIFEGVAREGSGSKLSSRKRELLSLLDHYVLLLGQQLGMDELVDEVRGSEVKEEKPDKPQRKLPVKKLPIVGASSKEAIEMAEVLESEEAPKVQLEDQAEHPQALEAEEAFKSEEKLPEVMKSVQKALEAVQKVSEVLEPSPKVSEARNSSPKVSEARNSSPRVSEARSPSPKVSEARNHSPKVSEASNPQLNVSAAVKSQQPKAFEARNPSPKVSEARNSSPKVSEARNSSPKVSEARNPSPKVSEARNPSPKISEARNPSPKASKSRSPSPKVSESSKPSPKTSESSPKASKSQSSKFYVPAGQAPPSSPKTHPTDDDDDKK